MNRLTARLTRSRDWQRATTRQLTFITNILERLMNAHEAITLAVNNAITVIQDATNQIAAKATEHDDEDLNELASRLQSSVSALSTASTRHGVEIAPTGSAGGETVTGAGGQPVVTTADTVPGGATELVQEGRPTFGSGAPAQGDQTNIDVSGNDTVSGVAGQTDNTTRRRP